MTNAIAHGWLAGWLFALAVTIGAGAWIAIGALTGGAWLDKIGPELESLSRFTPIVAIGGLSLFLVAPEVYPWFGHGAAAELQGSKAQWLSPTAFGVRSALALACWSLLGVLVHRGLGAVGAAMWLIVWAIGTTLAAADWMLAIDPDFVSTDIGFFFGIVQLAIALAVSIVLGGEHRATGTDDARTRRSASRIIGDLGALLLTVSLAGLYLSAMQYLVSWSGDLPPAAAWYAHRHAGLGVATHLLAIVFGTLVPFIVLLDGRLRRDIRWLRVAAVSVMAGVLLHLVWIVGPASTSTEPSAGASLVALFSAFAAVAVFGLTAWFVRRGLRIAVHPAAHP